MPKTASRSIRAWLKGFNSGKKCGHYHGYDVPKEYRYFEIFTVVRNPYERMWSWWTFEFPGIPFEDYMYKVMQWQKHGCTHFRNIPDAYMTQVEYINKSNAQKIIKFETLPTGLLELQWANHIDRLQKRNQTKNKPDIKNMTSLGKDMVTHIYYDDFKYLGYSK